MFEGADKEVGALSHVAWILPIVGLISSAGIERATFLDTFTVMISLVSVVVPLIAVISSVAEAGGWKRALAVGFGLTWSVGFGYYVFFHEPVAKEVLLQRQMAKLSKSLPEQFDENVTLVEILVRLHHDRSRMVERYLVTENFDADVYFEEYEDGFLRAACSYRKHNPDIWVPGHGQIYLFENARGETLLSVEIVPEDCTTTSKRKAST